MTDSVFISDLHLVPTRPETMQLFLRFNKEVAQSAEKLYILGDFLEIWWGDDDPAIGYADVFKSLTELSTVHGTEVYLMHGNRDFLIGEDLAKRCNFTLIDDPYPIIIQNQNALLMHGDTLCTDDIEYQKFRQMVRNPAWQQQVLSKSLEERYQLAQSLRDSSKQAMTEKDEAIMDVNQEATEACFIENHVDLIIHGHTHRPAVHKLTINNRPATRIVLGDWHESTQYLRVTENSELTLSTFM